MLAIARLLPEAEFAVVRIAQAYLAVLLIVGVAGVSAPVLRYGADPLISSTEKQQLFGHGLKITLLAFACAVLIGTAFAFLLVQHRVVEASLLPYAILLQVTPVVAIAPLIIIWVKSPTPALVVCATLVALFPIISNTVLGLRSVNRGLESLGIKGFTPLTFLIDVRRGIYRELDVTADDLSAEDVRAAA